MKPIFLVFAAVTLSACDNRTDDYLVGRVLTDKSGCAFTYTYTSGKHAGVKLILNRDETNFATCKFDPAK